MSIFNNLINVFNPRPRNPNDFVKKFIYESKNKRVQLELIYKNEIILQVDSLKFVTSWFKITDVDQKLYDGGYVIFFVLDKRSINKNPCYQNYLKSGLNMIRIEETHKEDDIITFSYFLSKSSNYMDLSKYMRKVIDSVYIFKENNPQILFNIRYLG